MMSANKLSLKPGGGPMEKDNGGIECGDGDGMSRAGGE